MNHRITHHHLRDYNISESDTSLSYLVSFRDQESIYHRDKDSRYSYQNNERETKTEGESERIIDWSRKGKDLKDKRLIDKTAF